MKHFKGKQFQKDVIIFAVGYYLRYNLSYREVQEILYYGKIQMKRETARTVSLWQHRLRRWQVSIIFEK